MNNRAFSKILILIVLIILIGGGLLVYQYLLVPKEKGEIPEETIEEEIVKQIEVERFKLNFGQIKSIEAEGLKIKFTNVTEDSRCPEDVQCFWEGQITIVVNIIKNEQNLGDFSLTSRSGHEDLAIKEFNGYSMKLLAVDPYPKSEEKIELSNYVITLSISKFVE